MLALPLLSSDGLRAASGVIDDEPALGYANKPKPIPSDTNDQSGPTSAAIAFAAELVGASACRPGQRAVLTPDGLIAVEVVDRFTERIIDLHWDAIAESLADPNCDLLSVFQDYRVHRYQLAFRVDQLPRAPFGRERVS